MESFNLHPPEADKPKATPFSEREPLIDGENLGRQKEISLDADLSFSDFTKSIFAKSENSNLPICLDEFQRDRHIYIVGRTGSGKSTLLERIVLNDINVNKATLFLDPHGESAERVLQGIKRKRTVAYFDLH
jgi:ABC-type bacteriocin/lantibiotic exporter with double-glycine peptidase domain